jgi:hypothetical protein
VAGVTWYRITSGGRTYVRDPELHIVADDNGRILTAAELLASWRQVGDVEPLPAGVDPGVGAPRRPSAAGHHPGRERRHAARLPGVESRRWRASPLVVLGLDHQRDPPRQPDVAAQVVLDDRAEQQSEGPLVQGDLELVVGGQAAASPGGVCSAVTVIDSWCGSARTATSSTRSARWTRGRSPRR